MCSGSAMATRSEMVLEAGVVCSASVDLGATPF